MKKNVISVKKECSEEIRKVQMRTALIALSGCVLECPVDSGRARFNFIITQNAPSMAVKDAPSSRTEADSSVRIGAEELKKTRAYSITVLENNLPYIEALNNGHSEQAKPGFVERSINKAIAYGESS